MALQDVTPIRGVPSGGDSERVLSGALAWQYPSRKAINIRNKGATAASAAAAFTAALADVTAGGVIYVPTGTWDVTAGTDYAPTFQINKPKVRIVGDGDGSIIRLKAGAATGANILYITEDDVTIEGVTFDLTSAITQSMAVHVRPTAARVRIAHCTFFPVSAVTASIYLTGACTDVDIEHNRILGPKFGVLTHDASTASRVRITDNLFDGQGGVGDGIEINTPTGEATDITSARNTVRNYIRSGPTANNGIGIGYAHVTRGVISENIVENVELDGIHVEDGSSGITVSDNRVRACGRSGITVNSSNTYATRYTSNITVHDNEVTGCLSVSGTGAIALEGNLTVKGCNVHDNHIWNNGRVAGAECYGIDLQFRGENHHIHHNQIRNTVGVITAGIRLAESSGVTVDTNRCWDDQGTKTQQYGIIVEGNQTNSSLLDNILYGNLTGTIDESAIGVTSGYTKRTLP